MGDVNTLKMREKQKFSQQEFISTRTKKYKAYDAPRPSTDLFEEGGGGWWGVGGGVNRALSSRCRFCIM